MGESCSTTAITIAIASVIAVKATAISIVTTTAWVGSFIGFDKQPFRVGECTVTACVLVDV